MNQTEYYNKPPQYIEEEEELNIDWMALIVKAWKGRKFIVICTFVFACLGVVSALLSKRQWNVSVTLAPEMAQKNAGGMSGIASMLGMSSLNLGNSTDALNITLFPDICSSTPFLTSLFDVPVTPYTSPKALKNGEKPKEPRSLYKYITKEDEPKGFFASIMESIFGAEKDTTTIVNISHLTPKQMSVVKVLGRSISANVDKKTGITTVGVTMDDPAITTQLAESVCRRLQDYVIKYRTQKATEDFVYYTKLAEEAHQKLIKAQDAYAQSVDYDRSVILQTVNSEKQRLQDEATLASQIYTQMEQQKEMARARIQEEKPVFAVIQPATMPENPAGKGRKMTVLMFIALGLIISLAWKCYAEEVTLNLWTDFKSKMKE